jgi:transcriptional regulator with XRE-family HTH domain
MLYNTANIKETKLKFGKLVKALRKRESISQTELAELLDLSRITIQNLESGKNFTIDTILKVAQHFNLLDNLNELLTQQISDSKKIDSMY